MLLSYGWLGKKVVSASYTFIVIHLFCNRRQVPESLPAFFIAQKQGKEKG
jgi:hypothetical protein